MPFVPVPNTAGVELRYTFDGQHVENTLDVRLAGAWGAAELATLGADYVTWWTANYKPFASTDLVLTEVVCTDLRTETGPQVTTAPLGGVAGDAVGEIMPGSVTLAVSFRTALRGRSYRGRNYVCGLITDYVSGSQINSSIADAVQAAYSAMIGMGAFTSDDWTWVVVSRYSGIGTDGKPIPRTEGIATPVTQVVITDHTIDSQRRRLPGRGR
jgi:hypothetical protein